MVDIQQVASFGRLRGRWTVLVDKEAGGQFWWTQRQVASFGGHRDRWPVLLDTETGGQFWWTQRQVASFRPSTSASPVSITPPVHHIHPSITEAMQC